LSCVNSFELTNDQFYLNQSTYRYDNEGTVFYDKSYLNSALKDKFNFRYRFLPFLLAKYEKTPIKELTTKHKIIIHYDQNLFLNLKKNNFEFNLISDPFYTVDFDLRYSNINLESEEYFPTIILMFNSTKFHHRITTSKGMRLFIILRFSIFTIDGKEIAYCQKHLFQNVFSNYFFSDYILQEYSPFLTDLNVLNINNNQNELYLKINECKTELF